NVPSGAAVQKLDSSGNFVWGAGWQADEPRWIGLDNKDSVYVCGDFSGWNKDFDPSPNTFLLSANGLRSGFIIKLNQTPLPTGIESINRQGDVSVFPNPSSGIVTFSSPLAIQRIQVTDMAGRLVYTNEPNKAKTVIDLGGKAGGVYFYEVDCGTGKQRGKLVIY
ncbi:MAG: T9SS type A sorting domain-containing protein, partial [Chitinophagaceae bacterium]